jgi:hypothetical protein
MFLTMSFPKRKRPWQGVLESEDRPTIVFLTVCTAARTSWLADQPISRDLKIDWADSDLLEGWAIPF